MPRPARSSDAVFVSAETLAARCEVGVAKVREWARSGVIPPAAVNSGQIVRWHWPSVEEALVGNLEARNADPFMQGVQNVRQEKHGRRHGAP